MTPQTRLRRQLTSALAAHLDSGKPPRIPEAGRLAWGWFLDLHGSRTFGFGVPNPIAFAEIEAYARLHRLPVGSHHIALIRALDATWMKHAVKPADGKTPPPSRPRQAITPAAFDAVFG